MTLDLRDNFIELFNFTLAEDIGAGDITSNAIIPADAIGSFALNAREEIVLCGAEVVRIAFPQAEVFFNDGNKIPAGKTIARVKGNVRDILLKERSVLNIIQHLSGVATETAKYVALVAGTNAKILDTRKTTPLLRILQKYAVKCGGGQNHRMGLDDMVLIKDNHIKAAGGITAALEKVKGLGVKVEIECDSFKQVKEAIKARPDVILADNMTNTQLKKVVALVAGRTKVEASGNANLKTVQKIAETGVDFISVGKLTHSVSAVDIGLDEV